jgi:hypothetical protein
MSSGDKSPSSSALITTIVVIVIGVVLAWKFLISEPKVKSSPQVIDETVIEDTSTIIKPIIEEEVDENINTTILEELPTNEMAQEIVEPTVLVALTPELNESDSWVQSKLSEIIWRKELLELLIDDDMVRRFVVFVDNFSQGGIAYSHSPFIKPITSFTGRQTEHDETIKVWEFDDSSFQRFSLYVDLLRSADTDTLVEWYKEVQPLAAEAYSELGYPEQKFEDVLQMSISKVLDFEFPKENIKLIRPSVMYQYQSAEIEALDDADKLMLRIGKDNLLIIKSVLLEINEKINKSE